MGEPDQRSRGGTISKLSRFFSSTSITSSSSASSSSNTAAATTTTTISTSQIYSTVSSSNSLHSTRSNASLPDSLAFTAPQLQSHHSNSHVNSSTAVSNKSKPHKSKTPTVSPKASPGLKPVVPSQTSSSSATAAGSPSLPSPHNSNNNTPNVSSLSRSNSTVSRSSSVVRRGSTVNGGNTSGNSSSSDNLPRFLIKENGDHEHHLRIMKRQEKLGKMLKDLLSTSNNNSSSKKLRNEMVSAVPNLLSSVNLAALDQQAAAAVALNNGSQSQPPSLMSSLIYQVKNGDITRFSNLDQQPLKQPLNPRSIKNDMPMNMEQINEEENKSLVENDNSTAVAAAIDDRTFLEKYGTLKEVVGRGTFGTVRVAHKRLSSNSKEEQLYAVKEFKRKVNESDKKYSSRLINEFCISSSLKHLNIISTFDLLKDSKSDYCEVMEYCSGGDLYSLIVTAGKLEYCEADCFFKQLIRGVNYMHNMGVSHRDLKPENLLLTNAGTLKITDFGNSECFKMAWEEHVQLSKGISGSASYIAPEEYRLEEFDPRPLDIWSCGVIYMAMRTGRQLWKVADSKEDMFYKSYLTKRKDSKGYEPIEMLKRARCRNVIYSILDPNPMRRITAKQVLNSEWVREIKVCEAGDCTKMSTPAV